VGSIRYRSVRSKPYRCNDTTKNVERQIQTYAVACGSEGDMTREPVRDLKEYTLIQREDDDALCWIHWVEGGPMVIQIDLSSPDCLGTTKLKPNQVIKVICTPLEAVLEIAKFRRGIAHSMTRKEAHSFKVARWRLTLRYAPLGSGGGSLSCPTGMLCKAKPKDRRPPHRP
jgi:hypothetical protein